MHRGENDIRPGGLSEKWGRKLKRKIERTGNGRGKGLIKASYELTIGTNVDKETSQFHHFLRQCLFDRFLVNMEVYRFLIEVVSFRDLAYRETREVVGRQWERHGLKEDFQNHRDQVHLALFRHSVRCFDTLLSSFRKMDRFQSGSFVLPGRYDREIRGSFNVFSKEIDRIRLG